MASSLPAFACFLGVWQGPENMGINNESDFEVPARNMSQSLIPARRRAGLEG